MSMTKKKLYQVLEFYKYPVLETRKRTMYATEGMEIWLKEAPPKYSETICEGMELRRMNLLDGVGWDGAGVANLLGLSEPPYGGVQIASLRGPRDTEQTDQRFQREWRKYNRWLARWERTQTPRPRFRSRRQALTDLRGSGLSEEEIEGFITQIADIGR